MGFFSLSKKERDVKTLSEKEIQLRLYGHLRSPHPASHDRAAVAHTKPIHPVVHGPQIRVPEEGKSLASKTASVGAENFADSKTIPASKRMPESDFFLNPQVPVYQHSKTIVSASKSRGKASDSHSDTSPSGKSSRGFLNAAAHVFFSRFIPAFLGMMKAVLMFIFQIVAAVLGAVSGVLLKVDFKNPRMRRIFSWTLAVGILLFLFAAIHILNLRREVAMKQPKKVSSIQVVKKKKAPEPPPQTSSTVLSDEASSLSSVSSVAKASSSPSLESSSRITPQKGQVIQIATFAILSDAEKLVAKFQEDGSKSFAKPLIRPGGKTYYCVFLGPFPTYQEAESQLTRFKKKEISKPFQDAFIRSL